MEFEIIETERLLLRKSGIEQLNFVFTNYADEELSTFLGAYTDTALATDKERFKQGFTSYNRSVVIFHLLNKTDNKVTTGGTETTVTSNLKSEVLIGN
jgi:hypothetical protein